MLDDRSRRYPSAQLARMPVVLALALWCVLAGPAAERALEAAAGGQRVDWTEAVQELEAAPPQSAARSDRGAFRGIDTTRRADEVLQVRTSGEKAILFLNLLQPRSQSRSALGCVGCARGCFSRL